MCYNNSASLYKNQFTFMYQYNTKTSMYTYILFIFFHENRIFIKKKMKWMKKTHIYRNM